MKGLSVLRGLVLMIIPVLYIINGKHDVGRRVVTGGRAAKRLNQKLVFVFVLGILFVILDKIADRKMEGLSWFIFIILILIEVKLAYDALTRDWLAKGWLDWNK